jgi:hypothetical protein
VSEHLALRRAQVTLEGLTPEWCERAAREVLRLESFLQDEADAGAVDDHPVDQSA